MPDVIKTKKEQDADSKFLDTGIGVKDIPKEARNQSIGANTKGGLGMNVSKKNDPFRRKNFGF